MLSPSEEQLRILWLKAVAATDPAEIDNLLLEFRDAVHEHEIALYYKTHPATVVRKLKGSPDEFIGEVVTPVRSILI